MNPIALPVLHNAAALPLSSARPLPTPPLPRESEFITNRSQWLVTPLPHTPTSLRQRARDAAERVHTVLRPYKFRLECLYWRFFPPNLEHPFIMVHSRLLSEACEFPDPFSWLAICRPAEPLFIGAKVMVIVASPFSRQLRAILTGVVLAMRGVGPKRIQLILGPNNGKGPLDYLEVERDWVRIPFREYLAIALSSTARVDPLAHHPVAAGEVVDEWTGSNCAHIRSASHRPARWE
ncbi:hypothetical protein FA95DRAFT_1614384 [Auriscalpium vulgare]|uniref:Uncharacterized protein n=1 Tax=Auriscalpium vulgare TaxID=40419 RepID=A0ACB8R0B7_9AGAM|nr:hypothetical protein FA95DRAFT_1614384 [Auriscalpium vulgare]